MIDKKELRLGNYVMYEQTTHVVTSMSRTLIETHWDGGTESYIHLPEELDPIPLTEEVLLRCGFEKLSGRYWLGGYPSGFSISDKFDDINMINSMYHDVKVSYLHELQNIVKMLTGKELKYNVVDVTSSNYDKQMLIEMVREEAKTLSIVLDVDLNSRSRQSETLDKRQVVMWKLFKHHNSYTRIGKALGFSHVSVRNAVLKVEDLLSVNDANMVKLANIISDL